MFSKISNQVYNLMGATKSEDEQEESSLTSIDDIALNKPENLEIKTKPNKSEIFTKVKSQFDSWIDMGRNKFKSDDVNMGASTSVHSEENIHQKQPSNFNIKMFSESLQTVVSKAEKFLNEAGEKIRKSVEEKGLFNDFVKKHEEFLKSRLKRQKLVQPPWVGFPNEQAIKEECLNLSNDRRNFIKGPPTGVDFNFDYTTSYPIAVTILNEDPKLAEMRFDLVPKIINEETFWNNYFYRIGLICNANELSRMAKSDSEPNPPNNFVSDSYKTNDGDLNEIADNLKQLSHSSKQAIDDEWNRALEQELNDFESDEKGSKFEIKSEFWEKDIDEMLNETNE